MLSWQIGFYKTFTRPIAKVLLMATFTYQLAYWAWVKLETDEVKEGKNCEWHLMAMTRDRCIPRTGCIAVLKGNIKLTNGRVAEVKVLETQLEKLTKKEVPKP